ncbi:hypothetical protein ACIRST_39370 [Kitasatospora sp. NPDC101447]|uniref:hypothetical protein n=1 Tax=Kitasatospora sp. NPDC101447 TaxID=3364102 RepID=UPI0038017A91
MGEPRTVYGPVTLAEALGLTQRLFKRARRFGLVPPPDVEDKRWSRALAEPVLLRREEIAAALEAEAAERAAKFARATARERDSYGPELLRRRLGLTGWQFEEARQQGLLPEPDTEDGQWSADLEARLRAGAAELVARLGTVPRVGAVKAATVLGQAAGLPVVAEDVHRLTEAGVLRPDGEFKGNPTYGAESLLAVPAAAVEEAVTGRLRRAEAAAEALRARSAQSLSAAEAAEELGWSARRLETVTARGGLAVGPDGRYDRAEVAALAEADPWR